MSSNVSTNGRETEMDVYSTACIEYSEGDHTH